MFSKIVIIVLVLQVAGVLMAPAVEDISTTIVGDKKVQDLLDSFSASKLASSNKVVKQTVTTTTTTTTSNDQDQPLQKIMHDPILLKQLKEFLYHFLQLFNALNKGSKIQVVGSSENVDVDSVLRDESIRSMLYSLFNQKKSSSGLGDLLTRILVAENPQPTPVTTEESKPIITDAHISESVINELAGLRTTEKPKLTATITNRNKEESNMETGENLINELKDKLIEKNNIDTTFAKDIVTTKNKAEYNVETGENLVNGMSEKLLGKNSIDTAYVVKSTKQPTVMPAESWEYKEPTAEELKQARNAKYEFATQIQDGIEGSFQQRIEIRDNGVVYGKSAYDDGNEFRITYYQADANGYRITREEVLPSKIKSVTGEANVQTLMNGNLVNYHITENDLHHHARKEAKLN